MALWIAPVPFPFKSPPSVVDPVPPKLTAMVVVPLVTPMLLVKRMEFWILEIVRAVVEAPPWRSERPVVVAPPKIVRPPDCVPLPIVEEACEMRPDWKI